MAVGRRSMVDKAISTPGGLPAVFDQLKAAYKENEAQRAVAEKQKKAKEFETLAKHWARAEAAALEGKKQAAKNLYFWRCEINSVQSDSIGRKTTFTDAVVDNDMPKVAKPRLDISVAQQKAVSQHLIKGYEAR